MILNKFKNLFSSYPIQTFTYFIPAPPKRKQGHREKSFDTLIQRLTKRNFQIIDIKTQAFSDKNTSGMWVVISLRPLSKEAHELAASDFPNDFPKDKENQKDNIILEQEDIIQDLAHCPTKNDNHQCNLKEIDLPKDHSLDDKDYKDEIDGIYYID